MSEGGGSSELLAEEHAGPPVAAVLIERITWLITLRWVAIGGVVCALEVARRLLPVPLPMASLYAVVAVLALYNLALSTVIAAVRRERAGGPVARGLLTDLAGHLVLVPVYLLLAGLFLVNLARRLGARALGRGHADARGPRRASLAALLVPRAWWGLGRGWDVTQAAAFASAQISLDLFALAGLLHFSGGIENPFASFFIFHVIISAILLSRPATYMQTSLAFGLFASISLGEHFGLVRHYPLGLFPGSDSPFFIGARLFALGTTLYLSAFMAGSIAARLRFHERDALLLSREVAQKAAALEQAYRRLAEVERAKSQYMRKVTHELRGPLGTIQTSLKVVLDGPVDELPQTSRDLVARAERRAGELAQVTQDLLTLSRAREGQLAVELSPVRLGELIRGEVEELRTQAEQSGITLALLLGAEVGEIQADPTGLRQMVRNLLSNAIRYTPPGGTVSVRLEQHADGLRLAVEDTGIGIPAEDIGRVFDEFFRSANARERVSGGTGLGLAIVRAVVSQLGGRVSVRSTLGQGTYFEVELPVAGAER